ncbi:MAG: transcriptional repressor [Bacteroidia bacterium]|nr:transcriptional repressor [Bacteroidia bacterium]
MQNHPTADQVLRDVHRKQPEISMATIYNTLEAFVQKGLISKVKTEKDTMRYDAIIDPHHHLYSYESDRIEDYFNEDLTNLVADYLKKNQIADFEVDDIKLQIIGKFKKKPING